jgi:4-hydroxyphenylpyruvate dioxygenase-like putative hemolysin
MPSDSTAQRILVIANRTCPCPELRQLIMSRAGASTRIAIVAPALNGRLAHAVSDTDGAAQRARARLDVAVEGLSGCEVGDVQAVVGDSDPCLAIGDALADFPADEIIISSWPEGDSNWLEKDLVERTRATFSGTVHHLVSEYGLEASEAGVA